MLRKALTVILFSLLAPAAARAQSAVDSTGTTAAPDYSSPERILEFADFLWNMEEYERALGEYQRYHFVSGAPTPSLAFRLAHCHFRLGHYPQAAHRFAESARLAPHPAMRDSALIGYASALYRANDTAPLARLDDSLAAAPGSSRIEAHTTALRSLLLLRQCRWREAGSIAERFVSVSGDSSLAPLIDLANEGLERPRKSPALSAALSAIVPGSGKVYCRRTIDGIYSFLLVGGSSWLAYEGFRDHGASSGKGWTFGAAALLLYAGNVYGSGVAAQQYNRNETEKLLDEVRLHVDDWTRF